MGNSSINFMMLDSKFGNSQFYNIMCTYLFAILQPTRVIEKSKTIIDNVVLSSFEFSIIFVVPLIL